MITILAMRNICRREAFDGVFLNVTGNVWDMQDHTSSRSFCVSCELRMGAYE